MENEHLLSERLTSLGIRGARLKVSLKPLNTIECRDALWEGGGPQLVPHDAERWLRLLRDGYVCGLFFSQPGSLLRSVVFYDSRTFKAEVVVGGKNWRGGGGCVMGEEVAFRLFEKYLSLREKLVFGARRLHSWARRLHSGCLRGRVDWEIFQKLE